MEKGVTRRAGQVLKSSPSGSPSERRDQRGPEEAVFLSNAILQEPAVAEMDKFRVIHVEEECRRVGPDLRCVSDLEWSTALRGWGRSEEHTSELQSRLHLVCR